jgi:uncharacterized protein
LCLQKNIKVNFLTTSKKKLVHSEDYQGYYWNPSSGIIDSHCIDGVTTIINLAGENVFQPWTEKARKRILESRINSLHLLNTLLSENKHEVEQLVSASAVGIYSSSRQQIHTEDEYTVEDSFLGKVVQKWESAADAFKKLGVKVVKIRIGLVLSSNGGALPQMMKPIKFNLGTPLGDGKQWQSWIHIDDLARIFVYAVENVLEGVYNGVAPQPVTNEKLIKIIAHTMGKKVWLPNVPSFALSLVMGDMSTIVLGSHFVSSKKIEETGFFFHYVNLEKALENLAHKKTG